MTISQEALQRDEKSKAVVVNDPASLQEYKKNKAKNRLIERLEKRLNILEHKVSILEEALANANKSN